MDDIVVSKDGAIKLLKGLNPSKALGPDELHPRVLKELVQYLLIFFSNQLTLVKSQRNGLLQIFAPFTRRVTGHRSLAQRNGLLQIFVPFSRRVTGHRSLA